MKAYLINLDDREDRLASMTGSAARHGFSFIRVAATNGSDPDFIARWPRRPSDLLDIDLGPGAFACLESHRKAWSLLVESGEAHALVVEDDIIMGEDFGAFLREPWWPAGADIVRLEDWPEISHKLDLRGQDVPGGRRAFRLRSNTLGSAAYGISAEAARRLLTETETFRDHTDALLFFTASPIFAKFRIFQVSPAPAIQASFLPRSERPDWAKSSLTDERSDLTPEELRASRRRTVLRRHLLPWAWKAKALLKGMRHQRVGFR
jgi:glycosyl transferase family 25